MCRALIKMYNYKFCWNGLLMNFDKRYLYKLWILKWCLLLISLFFNFVDQTRILLWIVNSEFFFHRNILITKYNFRILKLDTTLSPLHHINRIFVKWDAHVPGAFRCSKGLTGRVSPVFQKTPLKCFYCKTKSCMVLYNPFCAQV